MKIQLVVQILFNPIALRKTKIAYNFGLSECNKVKESITLSHVLIHKQKFHQSSFTPV